MPVDTQCAEKVALFLMPVPRPAITFSHPRPVGTLSTSVAALVEGAETPQEAVMLLLARCEESERRECVELVRSACQRSPRSASLAACLLSRRVKLARRARQVFGLLWGG
jgi:hypothetical protein